MYLKKAIFGFQSRPLSYKALGGVQLGKNIPTLSRNLSNVAAKAKVEVNTLPNGVRYVCDPRKGHFAGMGAYVKAGTRFETGSLIGLSHVMDRLAFQGTSTMSKTEMQQKLESLGGNHMCSAGRESLVYQSAVFNYDVKVMSQLLAQTMLHPDFTDEDLLHFKDSISFEISDIWKKPDLLLEEFTHATAFGKRTLGNSLVCEPKGIKNITRENVRKYIQSFYRPENLTLAYAGIPIEVGKELTMEQYGHLPRTSKPLAYPAATYIGGQKAINKLEAPEIPYLKDFSHIVIAMEGLSVTDPDIYALACLQFLLGGGGSFSAGGPGKGMYSRLYLNVLNQYPWVETCMAFNHSYSDSGLFGIFISILDDASHLAGPVILRELCNLVLNLDAVEVERAKKQLRSSLLMNLESRMISLEDLGRQIQTQNGAYVSPSEMCDRISSLTRQDLQRVAERVLMGKVNNAGKGSGKPTIVIHGDIEKVGDLRSLCKRAGVGRQ
ncbi:peptidase(MPP) complex alpha subunit Mas2 [Schizosaccharomyces japonicus yFS275]|uniref:Alpha-MPP n=1 Tax=Schizosaccharomyces japonicus (strain yFS275 / FY16936) TaxID=402676 RepID=B6K7D3_SCHJY|nr:peptidase(MPP) complex alpha subunit Mas2 [Schizosaccharomyces japonicus yFS275]EEB09437.1 peptidase(MPP) complex alpha subunit Mas2 [Schizosaccharomyces japonicus yFS275]